MQRLLEESEYFQLKKQELGVFSIKVFIDGSVLYYKDDIEVADYKYYSLACCFCLRIYANKREIIELFIKTYKITPYIYDFDCRNLSDDVSDMIRAMNLHNYDIEKHVNLVHKGIDYTWNTNNSGNLGLLATRIMNTRLMYSLDKEKLKEDKIILLEVTTMKISEEQIYELLQYVRYVAYEDKIYSTDNIYDYNHDIFTIDYLVTKALIDEENHKWLTTKSAKKY